MQRRSSKATARTRSVPDRQEARARAVRAIVFMNRLFEYECRDLDLSLAQYRLMLYLQHGPKRAGELATQASMTRPALSALIASMEQARLIRRIPVQTDRRGVRLEIAKKGLDALDRIERRFVAVFEDATADVDREQLVAELGDLCRALTLDIEARVRPVGFDSVTPGSSS